VGGDAILAVDGMALGSDDNIEKIRNRLAAEPPGTPFKMKVLRAGKVIELTGKTQ
jgi:S1-C subfamily serine protease